MSHNVHLVSSLVVGLVLSAAVIAAEQTPTTPVISHQTYYLTPGDGDAAIEAAIKKLKAGDTLVFKKGVHKIGMIKIWHASLKGTKDHPITIRGEDGAVIQGLYDKATNTKPFGPDKYSGITLGLANQWIVVENLEMTHNGTISVGNSNITYRNCHFHDYSNYGLITNGMKGLTIENCTFNASTVEHGIYLTTANEDVVIRNCNFSDTAINGVHINGVGNKRILIDGCTFHQVSRDWGACVDMMGATEVTIQNCVFYANLGHIFTITGKGKNYDTSIPRNLNFLFNTIYQPAGGRNGNVFIVQAPLNNVRVIGNVFAMNTKAFGIDPKYITDTTQFDYNIYSTTSGHPWGEHSTQDAHSIFDASLNFVQVPGWKDQTADLHLKAGSPGASGAPLLSDDDPLDHDGAARKQGGAFGAYAEPVQQ